MKNGIKIQHSTREGQAYDSLQAVYRFRILEYIKPTSVIFVYKRLTPVRKF